MRELTLSKMQNEYIRNADKRWNIKVGAVRSGKSFVDIAYMIPHRLRTVKDRDGLNVIIGVSKETIERNVLQPMREIYTSSIVGTINNRNIAVVCGVPVYCLGAEKVTQVSKIQGMSIKYCYGDEVARWSQNVFNMLKSRLDKPYSRFDGACNPESPNHWLKAFIDDEEISAYIQNYTLFDNPYLSREYVDNLCKEYRGTVFYERLVLGEWTLAEGLIYPMHTNALAEAPDGIISDYVLSIDYGTLNAFAALLWGKTGGMWYCLREYYYSGRNTQKQKTDEEYASDLEKAFGDVISEHGHLEIIIDPSAASFIALLKRREWCKVRKADNAVLDGIRNTATAMQTDKIKICKSCKNLISELQGYAWDDSAEDDRPIKTNDHACDAMRYFVQTKKIVRPTDDYRPLWN